MPSPPAWKFQTTPRLSGMIRALRILFAASALTVEAFALLEHMRKMGRRVQFAPDAKSQFLKFAQAPQAKWPGNFRDIEMSVYRLATLAQLGTIQLDAVKHEINRLTNLWQETSDGSSSRLLEQYLTPEIRMTLDRFESVQLADVISVCINSKTLSDAGRNLFSESRKKKRKANDADRLRKYLQKYDLDWSSNTPLWDSESINSDFDRDSMLSSSDVSDTILYMAQKPSSQLIEDLTLMPSGGAF